jgi:hypothetical protein
MRGYAGATGKFNDVTLKDLRRHHLRWLLYDLSRPGLCLNLGAGASHGLVPISPRDIAALAREILEANRDYAKLPSRYLNELQNPEVRYLTNLLLQVDPNKWDRVLDDFRSPGQATFVLNRAFTPRRPIPPALVNIYNVLENERGVIVSYNYDRVTDGQARFPIIAPHGQRSTLTDPPTFATVRKLAIEFDVPIQNDWWLPVPETELIRARRSYQEALLAWRSAAAIVFIGYGFGAGNDAFSFADFGRYASASARIHVLNPRPENADLCRQVGHTLRNRKPGFRVYGHPLSWLAFADAVLEELGILHANHIRMAIGREAEIGARHDRKCDGQ